MKMQNTITSFHQNWKQRADTDNLLLLKLVEGKLQMVLVQNIF